MVMARVDMEVLLRLLCTLLPSTPASSSFDGIKSRFDECFDTEDAFVGLLMVSPGCCR